MERILAGAATELVARVFIQQMGCPGRPSWNGNSWFAGLGLVVYHSHERESRHWHVELGGSKENQAWEMCHRDPRGTERSVYS